MKEFGLRGAVIGELTVERPVAVRESKVVWRAVCPCGAVQLRTTGQLTRARDTGIRPLCPRCLGEWRRENGYARRDRRIEAFYESVRRINPAVLDSPTKLRSLLRVLLDTFGLYGSQYDHFEEIALREEFAREDWRRVADFPVKYQAVEIRETEIPILESAPYETERSKDLGVDWANLYPIESPSYGYAYHCSDCEMLSLRGWGCVHCMTFSCFDCVANARHFCRDYSSDGMTLEAVGKEFDVNRERIRQIERRAMNKLSAMFRAAEAKAEAKCVFERWKILSRIPNPELEEARWAAEIDRIEEEKRQRFENALKRIRWEVLCDAMWIDGRVLPWEFRHAPAPPTSVKFGSSVLYGDPSDDELVCCTFCKFVLKADSEEWRFHRYFNQCWISPKPKSIEEFPTWVKEILSQARRYSAATNPWLERE